MKICKGWLQALLSSASPLTRGFSRDSFHSPKQESLLAIVASLSSTFFVKGRYAVLFGRESGKCVPLFVIYLSRFDDKSLACYFSIHFTRKETAVSYIHRALQFLYLQPTDFLLGGPFNIILFKIMVDSPFFHFNEPLYSLREHPVFSTQVSSFTRREEQFFSAGETRNLSRKNQMLSQASHYGPFPRSTDVFPVICCFALLEGEKGRREICVRFAGLYSPGALKILDSQGLNRGVAGGFFSSSFVL